MLAINHDHMTTQQHYAIVTETYPPEINGVALTVQRLVRGLQQRGCRVTLVRPRQTSDSTCSADTTLVRGLPLPRYPGLQFGLPSKRLLTTTWREDPPSAVYVATEGPLGWSAVSAARRLGIPVATGLHTRFDEYLQDYGLGFFEPMALAWMRYFHNRADNTVVPTEQLATFLREKRFKQVTRLGRAVDAERFTPVKSSPALRTEWLDGGTGPLVCYVGRIAAEKNLPLAIKAYRAIQEQHPGARFVWIGDGPARAAVERDNPDFIFVGMQLGEDLAQYLASTDLFLFPSKSETFGNVTVEALASGVPTVAFNYGAAKEHLINHEFGYTVDNDAEFIAASLTLASRSDRRAMGAAAHQAMRQLHPHVVAENFHQLLMQTRATRRAAAQRPTKSLPY